MPLSSSSNRTTANTVDSLVCSVSIPEVVTMTPRSAQPSANRSINNTSPRSEE
jgi:hypothetical protein